MKSIFPTRIPFRDLFSTKNMFYIIQLISSASTTIFQKKPFLSALYCMYKSISSSIPYKINYGLRCEHITFDTTQNAI